MGRGDRAAIGALCPSIRVVPNKEGKSAVGFLGGEPATGFEGGQVGPFCWALRVFGIRSAVTVGAGNFEFPACATADRSVAEPQKQIPITSGRQPG